MDRFKAGRIARIKVKGFMTYDDLELIPKHGLNMIIGLNGSGKSSIMSAICLGLGGKPQYTGKSAQPNDFIKLGHDKAYIEIELEEPKGRNVVISRTIQAEKSTYCVNGSPSNLSAVMICAKKYNIDVSNLCQFLPQEKVAEFSKMDKKKRLDNMLQSIGEPQLFTTFEELKQMRTDCNDLQKSLRKLNSEMDSEVHKNLRLQEEVDKQNERKNLKNRLVKLKHQKTVIRYEEMRHRLNILKQEKDELHKQLLAVHNTTQKLEEELGNSASERDSCISQMQGKQAKISALSENVSKNSNILADLSSQVHLAKVEFQTMINEKQNQQAKLAELKKQILGLEEQYKQMKSEEQNIKFQTSQNYSQHQNVGEALKQVNHKLDEINSEMNSEEHFQNSITQKLNFLKNEEEKRMNFLRVKYPPTYEAVCWLKQNMGAFKSRIHLPPLVTLKVPDPRFTKFIENNVNIRDLLVFVCEDKDDVKRLTEILRHEKKLPVNIALAPDSGISAFSSPPITPRMRQMGIECFLRDIFVAPEPVVCYLCQIYNHHRVPICNENADKNVEGILGEFRAFFMENERITGLMSKYGNKNLSVKRDHIMAKNILVNTKDQSEELHRLQTEFDQSKERHARLKEQYEAYQSQRSDFERKLQQIRQEKLLLADKEKKINSLAMQLRAKREMYQRNEALVIDEAAEKAKKKAKICAINDKKMHLLKEICADLKELNVLKMAKAKRIPFVKVLVIRLSQLTEQIKEAETEKRSIEEKYAEKGQEHKKLKTIATSLYEKIREIISQEGGNKELTEICASNPMSLDDIERNIANIEAQLELNCEENADAVREFEERKKQIAEAEETIKDKDTKMKNLWGEMERLKVSWLQRLETHISNINTKFTQYYKFLECAGEVTLDKTEDTNNFLDYGLQIRLKYRVDEEFMELSQTHHSGGECSVAAIIFILSLQELTNVPFRCIDEINQGMDSVNERKIYELIADASRSGSSCSQYFLLTPKLLMDLAYNDGVAVHIVYNSRFLGMKLNLKEHLQTVKSKKR
ncbi:hypothetical protein JTE90_008303 [Oedothorax gibbosus]|uniref:Structural maintenance of chromosomes protein 5 n=1 Tax=Oedothorax gibbosus TaxID=931172 RepID=A0AAV6UJB6_9ARAC|nr:hypothetical protein JTE90_008303 [Oedothorax gibbosus]